MKCYPEVVVSQLRKDLGLGKVAPKPRWARCYLADIWFFLGNAINTLGSLLRLLTPWNATRPRRITRLDLVSFRMFVRSLRLRSLDDYS